MWLHPRFGRAKFGAHQDEVVAFSDIYICKYIYMCVYVCVFLLEVKQLCLLHGLRNLETMTNHVIQKRSFIPLRKAQYWFWTERTASL